MNIIVQLYQFIVWLFLEPVTISNYSFNLISAILFAGIISIFLRFVVWLFKGE